MKRISTLGLTVALILWEAAVQAVELMHWERLPLAVPLVINPLSMKMFESVCPQP